MFDDTRKWFSDRMGAPALVERLRERRVSGLSPTHFIGGVLLMLFLLEVASGILLMLPYRPDPQHAHASVVAIAGRLPYGSLVRGVHAWTSHMFVAMLFVQIAAVLLNRVYREPKELVWWTGLLLLAVGVSMAFTGALLPWSQNAYLQARVSSEMIGQGPIFGPWLKRMLRGGDDITPWSLGHAYGFHTGVLPAMATLLFGFHMAVVRRSAGAPVEGATVPVYPEFLVRLAAVCTAVLLVVVSLATFVPVAVGTPVNMAGAPPSDVLPPWYFLFIHDLLRAAPPRLLGVESAKFVLGALSLLALFAVALPFIDRKGSKITAYVGAVLIVVFLVLTGHAIL